MLRIHNVNGIEVPFTAEEEAAEDAIELEWNRPVTGGKAVRDAVDAEEVELEAKLADDSITFEEMKELMRLRG